MRMLLILALLAGMPALTAEDVLTVDTTTTGFMLSPDLWGVFFEEINHSGDGGLYAEMVRNRSFEDNRIPEGCTVADGCFVSPTGWKLKMGDQEQPHLAWSVAPNGADVNFSLETAAPINKASVTYARVEVKQIPEGGKAGITNEGYWGMSLKEGEMYCLSLFLRSEGEYTGNVIAALESADGAATYASAALHGMGEAWSRFKTCVVAKGSDDHARLALYLDSPGAMCFDVVSLFPAKTFMNRANGLRPDLAQMVADLKPSFIRFPGGCIVEGFTSESAWHWKETLGDISERPGRQNLWGYRATDGLGYHELLQFAEDINAKPIFVVNCGMTCQGRNPVIQPLDNLEPWIQDALDAIEYANGGVDTTWGAKRAMNGHPAPFNMQYITIGNENGGADYVARYNLFAKAIAEKYPNINLIANSRAEGMAAINYEEQHFYMTPAWFSANSEMYDFYNRGLPLVFVSEFAANQACGKGNLDAAVGESAFMIGMENNSDIVRMAAYAPLFNNEHNREWPVNLIVFDDHSAYGTPSYYAQKLFSVNRPSTLYKLDYTTDSRPPVEHKGRVGVGAWNTSAEFVDMTVSFNGNVAYQFDAQKGMEGIAAYGGDWSVEHNALCQKDMGTNRTAQFGDPEWTDYSYTLKARKIAGDEGFLILFRCKDPDNWYWLNLGGWGNTAHGIECAKDGQRGPQYPRIPGTIETGRWYSIRITVTGERMQVFLDDSLLFDEKERTGNAPSFKANAGRSNLTGEIILKAANYSDRPANVRVKLQGVSGAVTGLCTVLTHPDRAAENSLDEPLKVVPATTAFTSDTPEFIHEFPAFSLTVFRLHE